jgi:HK97 family phage prohead protease
MGKKMKKKFDFGGYATKVNIKCTDGRTIKPGAFKHCDGQVVPLVWQHMHDTPENILGQALLEHRDDGVYAYCTFNNTDRGQTAKALVVHGDVTKLSIFANQLKQKVSDVIHGMIREVSLVLSGANSGAVIDNVAIQHMDGTTEEDISEAIIRTTDDDSIELGEDLDVEHGENDTVEDIFNTFNDEQKDIVYAMIAHAVDNVKKDTKDKKDKKDGKKMTHDDKGDGNMKKNLFNKEGNDKTEKSTLTHDELRKILEETKNCGSFKEAFLAHAGTYGIEDIDLLFPDAKSVQSSPELVSREMAWVNTVISGAKHSPFSRIKTLSADITADEARAKGYVKGNEKTDEIFGLLKRTTTPTTIYKKQKLDRDDIIDITDLDVVAWIKKEMRLMLNEEIARAILISDGRAVDSDDKITEANIKPIYKDADLYSHKVQLAADKTTEDIIDEIIKARKNYKGTGKPVFYTTSDLLTDMLLLKDTTGRRIYKTEAELAATLRVSAIHEVEVMEDVSRDVGEDTYNLLGIIVSMKDYTIGADKGGKISMFDDFDIDYNQYKYLLETRISGALTKTKSALVIEQIEAAG